MKTSCLIPCHNAYPHLLQCLRSLAKQFDEVIVYFDACGDDSQAQVEFLCEDNPHLILLSGDDNIGSQQARNLLYEYSTGDYICFFDADDFREKSSVSQLVDLFQSLPEDFGCIVTPYYHCVRDPLYRGQVYRSYLPEWMEDRKEGVDYIPSVWEVMAKRQMQTGGMLWRRECLEHLRMEKGSIWDASRPAFQDAGLLLDAIESGWEVAVYPLITHTYRWGWSQSQLSVGQEMNYLDHAIGFLARLESLCPDSYKTMATLNRIQTEKLRDEIAHAYENHFLPEPVVPCFD